MSYLKKLIRENRDKAGMSDEPDLDEAKEWEDLEGEDLPVEDEGVIDESED